MFKIGKLARLAFTLGFAASISAPAAAAGVSIRGLAAQQLRLASIGYRIAVANRASCARPETLSGLVLHDLTQYPRESRAAIANAFALHGGFGVLGVVPGSAASRASLQVDDEIIGLGNRGVEGGEWVDREPRSYGRMSKINQLLQQQLAGGTSDILVRRKGAILKLRLSSEKGCGGQIALEQTGSLNAWSDGTSVVLSTAIVNFAKSDDELAFVIAHEMAHNILQHSTQLKTVPGGILAMFGFGSARIRRTEVEADSYGVALMDNGGYAPAGALNFLKDARRKMWWNNLSIDHPGFGSRLATVTNQITAINYHKRLALGAVEPRSFASELLATRSSQSVSLALR